MTPLTAMLLNSVLVMIAVMTCLWLLSLARRDASSVGNRVRRRDVVHADRGLPQRKRSWLLATLTTARGLRQGHRALWGAMAG